VNRVAASLTAGVLVAGSLLVGAPPGLAAVAASRGSQVAYSAGAVAAPAVEVMSGVRASDLVTVHPRGLKPFLEPRGADWAGWSGPLTGPELVFVAWSPAAQLQTLLARNEVSGVVTELIQSRACFDDPQLSPDGTYVAFTITPYTTTCSSTAGNIDTWSGLLGGLQMVPPKGQSQEFPSWSPNSSTVLFTRFYSGTTGFHSALYTALNGGSTATAVPGAGAAAYDGTYSPDGTEIAYSSLTTGGLAEMTTSGVLIRDLTATNQPKYLPSWPAWSPDGSKLCYTYYPPAVGRVQPSAIAIVNADGTGLHTLKVTAAPAGVVSFHCAWSADGSQVYFDSLQANTATGALVRPNSIFATPASGAYGGLYQATLLTSQASIYFSPSVGPPSTPAAASASLFTPVAPDRVLARTKLAAGGYVDVNAAAVDPAVPATATAVTVNLTGVDPLAPTGASTVLRAYPTPSDASVPAVSNLNLAPGQTAAVAVQVPLSSGGQFRIRNDAGTVGVLADVTGYFTPVPAQSASGYFPLPVPVRALGLTTIGSGK